MESLEVLDPTGPGGPYSHPGAKKEKKLPKLSAKKGGPRGKTK